MDKFIIGQTLGYLKLFSQNSNRNTKNIFKYTENPKSNEIYTVLSAGLVFYLKLLYCFHFKSFISIFIKNKSYVAFLHFRR